MTYETLRAEREGRLGLITLDRPRALNALNSQMCEELQAVMELWAQRGDVHAAILTGAGEKAFVAGADIKEMHPLTAGSAHAFLRKVLVALSAVEQFPYPVIAAVNGFAFGGGCEIAMACDIRIASERAQFALPEVGLGIIPGGGGTQRLPRLIGLARARELIYTGRALTADEALQLGLVNRVVAAGQLEVQARALATEMLAKGPMALRMAKEATALSTNTPLSAGLEGEILRCSLLWDTSDQKEGMQAFMERRRPNFQGH